MPLTLTLYSRNYCHLCKDMFLELSELQETQPTDYPFELEVVDVDASEQLESQYGHLVPVLCHEETEICHYFLDKDALKSFFLDKIPPAS